MRYWQRHRATQTVDQVLVAFAVQLELDTLACSLFGDRAQDVFDGVGH
jgi:hypothetical protein